MLLLHIEQLNVFMGVFAHIRKLEPHSCAPGRVGKVHLQARHGRLSTGYKQSA